MQDRVLFWETNDARSATKEFFREDARQINPAACPTSTCSAEDFPVWLFQWPETEKDLPIPEELCSLNLPDWLRSDTLRICSLKTYPACYSMSSLRKRKKLRVAAYCRVSTEEEEQQHSFETRAAHYTEKISSHPDWTLAGVFADDGISGVRAKKRDQFLEMIDLCRRKKIDLMLSILLAVAQEKSQAKSENIKFGIRQRMRSGKAILNHSQLLGYTKGTDGKLIVVPEEAEIVRKIFELYLQGNGVRKIKNCLESNNIKTVTGKSEWSTSTIDRMLSNEKYVGQLVMQKTYTPDFLNGKQKLNIEQENMIIVENSHEPIIEKATFDTVQNIKSKS